MPIGSPVDRSRPSIYGHIRAVQPTPLSIVSSPVEPPPTQRLELEPAGLGDLGRRTPAGGRPFQELRTTYSDTLRSGITICWSPFKRLILLHVFRCVACMLRSRPGRDEPGRLDRLDQGLRLENSMITMAWLVSLGGASPDDGSCAHFMRVSECRSAIEAEHLAAATRELLEARPNSPIGESKISYSLRHNSRCGAMRQLIGRCALAEALSLAVIARSARPSTVVTV
jgi:hypothetical protein